MSKEKKAETIDRLHESFSKCSIGILTNYQGLSALEMTQLRRKLKGSGIEYKVLKNTLARLAAEKAGKGELASSFVGPLAVAFGYGNITEPAKTLTDYIRTSKVNLAVKGGFLGSQLLTQQEVVTLATLPPREVLLARVAGGVLSPLSILVSQLSSPIQGLIRVLQARIQSVGG